MFPPPADLPSPGIEPRSPTLQVDSLLAEPQGKPKNAGVGSLSLLQRIFPTQILNWGLLHAGGFFTNWAIREAQCSADTWTFFRCRRLWIIGQIWRMVRLQSGDCQELWSWSGSSEPWREWPWDLGQWACLCSLVWLKTEARVFCATRRHVLSCVKHLRFLQNPEVREAFSPRTCDFLTAR